MTDLFGRKARAELASYKRMVEVQSSRNGELIMQVDSLRDANDRLIRELREMDQCAFALGQQYGQNDIAPTLRKLCAMAASRQQAESNRIRDVLIPEMRKVYNGQ